MTETIITSITCSLICILLTFILTNGYDRKAFKVMLDEKLLAHERTNHTCTTSELIEKHEDKCPARQDLEGIKLGLAFLISKQPDGDPRKFGLIK